MKITSTAFLHGKPIPTKYTCDGEDINPELHFSDVPNEAVTLALILDDPDAPGKTWTHWVLWNIAPAEKGVGEGEVPEGCIEGLTSFGRPGYGGPCPPSGTHRYFFKLYALDVRLDLLAETTKKGIETAMAGHVIEQAELMGTYARPKD